MKRPVIAGVIVLAREILAAPPPDHRRLFFEMSPSINLYSASSIEAALTAIKWPSASKSFPGRQAVSTSTRMSLKLLKIIMALVGGQKAKNITGGGKNHARSAVHLSVSAGG